MKPSRSLPPQLAILYPSLRRLATGALALCLFGCPALVRAADPTNEVGVRLLEAELRPSKLTLLAAKCDPVVIAVGKTTLAHPRDAVAILDAALTRRIRKLHDKVATLPCTCARRIFLASMAAAPKQASELLDLAAELYPDCAGEFAGALGEFDGFGVGFGTGFPGSPGFSPPSIGVVVPPPTPVTSVVNG